MIVLDNRVGSKELLSHFPKSLAKLGNLEYADACFLGNGPEGPVMVGVERKALGDLLSSMQTGRLAGHQLLGLINSYHTVYLIVEGIWRTDPRSGLLEVRRGQGWTPFGFGKRQWMTKEMDNFLNTLEVIGGVVVRTTPSMRETASLITNTYHWWSKEWEDHKSHLAIHKGRVRQDSVLLTKPSLVRRVSAELAGISFTRSKEVDRKFKSVKEMVAASKEDWLSIPSIGEGIASSVMKELDGER